MQKLQEIRPQPIENPSSAEFGLKPSPHKLTINNATVAYFIIEKPRLGPETYSSIINQTQQNNLQTYKIFYYPEGEEKLRIFYYKKSMDS